MRSKVSRRASYLGLLCTLAGSGCTIFPPSPSKRPNKSDLIGTWIPTAATVRLMRDEGGYNTSNHDTKIVLKDDGSLEMDDIPDWWFSGITGRSSRTFRSAAGTWDIIGSSESGWGIGLNLPLSEGSTELDLSGRNPPYQIYLIIGDPDRGTFMYFYREGH